MLVFLLYLPSIDYLFITSESMGVTVETKGCWRLAADPGVVLAGARAWFTHKSQPDAGI